jgi:hypothetical protein
MDHGHAGDEGGVMPNTPYDVPLTPIIDTVTGSVSEIGRIFLRRLAAAVGALAPITAPYWLSTSDPSLTNEQNLGALASGYLKITQAIGIAVPSTVAAIPATDLSGTLPDARFPATLPAASGANLTGLVGGQVTYATVAKVFADSPYTLTATDVVVDMNATGGASTVKLPAAPVTGRLYGVLKSDASGNGVTLSGNGHTINGAATVALAAQYSSRLVRYTGTEFLIVAST